MGFWNLKTLRLEEFRPGIFCEAPRAQRGASTTLHPGYGVPSFDTTRRDR